MAIMYIHQPTSQAVSKEAWRWVALYDDGTQLQQFGIADGAAYFHKFDEIDQAKLTAFRMEHDSQPPMILSFDPATMALLHFYRNRHLETPTGSFDDDGSELIEKRDERLFCFGYTDKRTGHHHLTAIRPDNSIIIGNNPDGIA